MERCKSFDTNGAFVLRRSNFGEMLNARGVFDTVCYASDGHIKWHDVAWNLVVDQGKNAMLDSYFAGISYTASWYMSLIVGGAGISSSTYADPTVTEVTNSIIANRQGMAWHTASSAGVKTAAVTSLTLIGSATIIGNMVITAGANAAVVGDTSDPSGILFSTASFSGGSKSVSNGDVLNVTYSIGV
jgi:hypothetical protein